ncbi:uncharacterized protein [Acropora muricata]|uniref:uncharacterized protein n=1 Tax=Acropora muricata TaxID=159855 RepID=UPI0034E40D59
MPERCVAARCNNTADPEKGISIHRIPFFNSENAVAQKRRKKWIDFVLARRKNWKPGRTSSLCSIHFKEDDFQHRMDSKMKRSLKSDEIGICVYPSIHAGEKDPEDIPTKRGKRMLIRSAKARMSEMEEREKASMMDVHRPSTSAVQEEDIGTSDVEIRMEEETLCIQTEHVSPTSESAVVQQSKAIMPLDAQAHTLKDYNTIVRELEVMSGKLKSSREALKICKRKKRQLQSKVKRLTLEVQSLYSKTEEEREFQESTLSSGGEHDSDQGDPEDIDDTDTIEEEPDFSSGSHEEFFSENTEDTETEDDDTEMKTTRIPLSSTQDIRTEPKHIVFMSKLLLLFQFCHICRTGSTPEVKAEQRGTAMVIKTICTNSKCRKEFVWSSQPFIPGTKILAGNFLMCMAVLCAGGSFTKVRQMFLHMGLACVSLRTFFRHQQNLLIPTIHLFWKRYQANLFSQLKDMRAVTLSGDGRHDSMGHCAKYCAYTIFCCTLPRIIHFALVQRNQAGSSPAMEFFGFKNCMDYLLGCGITIEAFISDRHSQIASHMKNAMSNITHYFDLWHLKKKITKLLTKISREKGNEEFQPWIKPCERHLYWSATSTIDGCGKVIYAKFRSFLSHIINKHTELDDPLFNKCAHGDIPDRKWIDPEHTVYEKVKKALSSDSLRKGIQQASPSAQTDCLEGFHSVLNQFAPKIIAYSYLGMYCRHIIAALHFNYNLHREDVVNQDGSLSVKVTYPKFKNGEATVRSRKVEQNFDYVGELFQFFMGLNKQQLQDTCSDLKTIVPEPMNTMLEKEPRELAITKQVERSSIVVKDVPPTTAVSDQVVSQRTQQMTRARPLCSACKKPMRGHKSVTDCPRNRKEC